MSPIRIHTLPPVATAHSSEGRSLRAQIEAGLLGTAKPTIPGNDPADRAWAFKRSVPTLVLYDEQGLR